MRRTIARASLGLLLIPASLLFSAGRAQLGASEPSVVLPNPALDAPLAKSPGVDTAVFAGGCFWGVEGVYEHVKGVISATSGYSGGMTRSPSYDDVSSGRTGHAEVVRVVYDPSRISYGQLLRVFFSVAHDPTQLNRQGPDRGTQYRSAIFFNSDAQKRIASAYIAQITAARAFAKPIVTQVAALGTFTEAEAYHQGYMARHPNQPYIVINDAPKVANLKRDLKELYREPGSR